MAAASREAASRLRRLAEARQRGEFTFERLHELAGPVDRVRLAEVLATLVREGLFEQFVRVESPHGNGGIGDFPSFLEVPERMDDWRNDGAELVVRPEHLRLFYRVASKA